MKTLTKQVGNYLIDKEGTQHASLNLMVLGLSQSTRRYTHTHTPTSPLTDASIVL